MALSHFIFFQSKLVGRYVSSTLVDPIPCGGRRLFGDQPRTKIPASFRLSSSIRPDPPHIGIHWLNGCIICFITPYLNAVLFLAFFMLTDPPTSPAKNRDQIIFGILCAVVSCVDFYLFNSLSYLLTGLLCANA